MCVGETGNASVNCAPARQLKMCWWMALLSLAMGAHWDGEKANGCNTEKKCSDIFKLKYVYICETSELAERKLCAQTETKGLVAS